MSAHLLEQLKQHEGFRSKPYQDTEGIWTVGYGYNLEQGMSKEEAHLLLGARVRIASSELHRAYPHSTTLQPARRDVLVNMVYNMGISRFMGFKRMLLAIDDKDWASAAAEMLDSKWARQVRKRANVLANQMREGEWQT